MKLVLRIVWYIYFFIFYCWRFNFLKSIFFLFYPNFKKSVTAVQPNYFGTCNVFLQFLSLRYPPFCASHPNLWRIALHQIWGEHKISFILSKSLNQPTHPRVFVRFGNTKGEIRVKKKRGDFWGDFFFGPVWKSANPLTHIWESPPPLKKKRFLFGFLHVEIYAGCNFVRLLKSPNSP